MKRIHFIAILFVVLLFYACNYNKQNLYLTDESKKILKTSFEFKHYEDGIGADKNKPIYSDSILILKNKYSGQYNFVNISKKKIIDSVKLCKSVFENDDKFILMQPFLLIEKHNDSLKKYAVTWGAQYHKGKRCIELWRKEIE